MVVPDKGRQHLLPPIVFLLLALAWAAPPEIHPEGAVLAMGLLGIASLALVLRPGEQPLRAGGGWLILIAGPVLLSHLLAVDRGGSWRRLVALGGAAILFAAARRLEPRARLGLLLLVPAAGGVLALHGIVQALFELQWMSATPGLAPEAVHRLSTGRVFSRFLLPSVFASFLLLALPLAVGRALQPGRARWLFAAVACVMVPALLLTRSHGALAALAVTALLLWRPRRGGVLALAAVLALVGVIAARGGALFASAEEKGPLALRARNTRAALEMIRDHPLAGVGGNGFGSAYTEYRRPGDNETRFVHNVYLQAVSEHGLPAVPGLLLLLAGLSGVLRESLRRRGLHAAAGFGLAALMLHAAVDVSLLLPSLLWTVAAVAGALAGECRGPLPPRPGSLRMPLAALPAAAVLVLVGVGTALADRSMERAAAHLARTDEPQARAAAELAERRAPWLAGPPLMQAEILLRQGDATQAAAAAQRAVERNRAWPAALRTRAYARLAAGDAGAAAGDLLRASELYPMRESYGRDLDELQDALAARRPAEGGP